VSSLAAAARTLALALLVAGGAVAQTSEAGPRGLGRPLTESDLAGSRGTVFPDGRGLPPGSGTVGQGESLYSSRCLLCHGADGQGGPNDRLAGGRGSLREVPAIRTVESYWPYASTLFNYVRRSMPFDAPGSLSDDEVYAVVAYVLHLGGLVDENAELDAATLAAVRMPNREGFFPDDRPDAGAATP